jgi:colicin import membrane protein
MADRVYKVFEDPSVPPALRPLYALEAVRAAEERRKQQEDQRKANAERYARDQQLKTEEQARIKKQAAAKAEADREQAAEQFDAELRSAFFAANLGADEATLKRLLPGLRDERMKRLALDRITSAEKARLAEYRM